MLVVKVFLAKTYLLFSSPLLGAGKSSTKIIMFYVGFGIRVKLTWIRTLDKTTLDMK